MRASTTFAPASASAPARRAKMPGWSDMAKQAWVASRAGSSVALIAGSSPSASLRISLAKIAWVAVSKPSQ